ncbi:MAG: phosphoglucosamine mutase, partial [Endomicrobia bacterium]|nr:phosphoglucosamine mutase [Endomicrobiia bacterium]
MKTYEKHIKFFGTDGIRGDASKFPFDDYTLSVIGRSAAEELHAPKGTILILRDTRQSGERIERALAKGIAQAGLKTVFAGVLTTPAAAALLKSGKYCAAVVISASHNPWEDNGIKIFNSKGSKLSDSTEMRIEKRINSYLSSPKNLKSLKCKAAPKKDSSLLKTYENFIIKNFGKGSLKGKTIVVDCANGAAYKCAPAVLKKLGAKVIALNTKPDGKNINLNCGALHPECAAQAVKKNKAFCGFAFDGDADRLICIDETGVVKDGDFFLAAMSADMKKRGKLRNNILVTTVMANLGLMLAMKAAGIKTIVSKVGDRYVLEDMKKYKASLGGEQSGHFIFLDILGTGDGLLSAVRLLAALNRENKT